MKPTRIRRLLEVAVVVGLLAWLLLHYTYSALPPLPWTMTPTLLLLAMAELVTALNTRARIRRRPGARPVEPLVVARMAALAKASAYTAAVVAGAFAGVLVYVLPEIDKEAQRLDTVVGGATLGATVLFAATALFLEHSCRVPEPPEEQERSSSRP
ncbi:MAG: DUF3180 family protein [Streptosporangiales bacterium]|nr:DUF3180 family protein [Streptosporangiales bacterium]